MASYAIGDIQGCYPEFMQLLELIEFDKQQDHLFFCGDLVNRGSDSLGCLRFIRDLGNKATTVLGNHDLTLLGIHRGKIPLKRSNPDLEKLLAAPDCKELLNWLIQQPLLHVNESLQFVLSHAGVLPTWNLETACDLSKEVESVLQSNQADNFFSNMFGNTPDTWDEDLKGFDRLRFITNVFTRMRFCTANGKLELATKDGVDCAPSGYKPWFDFPLNIQNKTIIFGHWASLGGLLNNERLYGLDTGCVWGGQLTALCIETKQIFQVPGQKSYSQ